MQPHHRRPRRLVVAVRLKEVEEEGLLGAVLIRRRAVLAKAAVRWLRAHAEDLRIDTNRIFLAGYSAGGTAALRVAASPDDPGSSGNPDHASSVSAVVAVSAKIEPGRLEAAAGPTLLIHGTADTKVPFAEMEEACAAVARCELVPVEGGVHHMINTARDEILSATVRFLHTQVTAP